MKVRAVTRRMSLRKGNGYLLAGAALLLLILGATAGADYLGLRSPVEAEGLLLIDKGYTFPPYSPGNGYPLGSDSQGRDLLSRIIYGGRLSLTIAVAVALARTLIGVAISGLAKALSGRIGHRLNDITRIFSGVSTLVFATITLYIVRPWARGDATESILWFVSILAILGWGRVADLIWRRIETILREPFVDAAVASGLSRTQILLRHIVPHLTPTVIVSFVVEAAQSMLIMGQLAIFGIFAGGRQT